MHLVIDLNFRTLRTTEPSERFNKDYVKYQKMMLSIEDLTVKKAVSGYTMLNKTINRIGMSRLFTITVSCESQLVTSNFPKCSLIFL